MNFEYHDVFLTSSLRYGNKCKFYHAERGNQPQKSVTEKLKETSSQKINEIRARGNSRESSPGSWIIEH